MESSLYLGKLQHRCFSPREHQFAYPVLMAFLDIDRLPELLRISPFCSYNQWNCIAYNECDHFGRPRRPLRERLRDDAERNGVPLPDGKIFLLTHLRYFGYLFNPVSFFYCYNQAGALVMILSEVNNTFGEPHNYWLTPEKQRPNAAAMRYITPKAIDVSPLDSIELEYVWIFTPPGEQLFAYVNTLAQGQTNFDATLQLERRPWNARELFKILISYPLMALRVAGGFHWEAMKLGTKGVPVYTHAVKLARQAAGIASKGEFAP